MRYHNFDLWMEEKDSTGYRLRADSEGHDAVRGLLPLGPGLDQIAGAVGPLDARRIDRQSLVDTGTLLYGVLFSAQAQDINARFQQYLGEFLGRPAEGVRLRLHIEAPELAALPWEFLYWPVRDTFLGTWIRTPLVRYLDVDRPVPVSTCLPVRILVVIPDSPDLDAGREKALLQKALHKMEAYVETTFLENEVSLARIEETLREERFHVFHFIGHGDFAGEQGVLDLGRETGLVDHETLGRLFQNHEDMKLVFLNACQGARVSPSKPFLGIAPQLVRRGVPAVVAMQYSIYDEVAVMFAGAFYHSLFSGTDRGRVDVAMTHARNVLCTHYPEEREFGAPVLFLRSPDGILFNCPPDKKVSPALLSAGERHRLEAVAQTHRHNIEMAEKSDLDVESKAVQVRHDTAQLQQIQQTLRYRKAALLTSVVVALLVLFLSLVSFFDFFNLDTRIESYTMALGGRFVRQTLHPDIAIVSIDAETEKEVGSALDKSWRQHHAALIESLTAARAKAIVLDLKFTDESEWDDALGKAIAHARQQGTHVIIGSDRFDEKGRPVLPRGLVPVGGVCGTLRIGKRVGCAWLAPLVVQKAEDQEPVFGLGMLALAASKGAEKVELVDFDKEHRQIVVQFVAEREQGERFRFFESDEILEKVAGVLQKGDLVANLAIDLTPLPVIRDRSRRYSYTEIRDRRDPEALAQLRNKIVVVGGQTKDYRYGGRYGYELHTDAINTLLNQVAIVPAGTAGQFIPIVLMSIVASGIRTRTTHTSRRRVTLLLVAALLLYLAGTIYVYSQYRLLLNAIYPAVALFLTFGVVGKLEGRYLR
jgi:CHASE2 domain-containing sensor protein